MTSGTTNIIVGILQDVFVVAGGMITTAMMASGTVTMPSWPVVILAILTGGLQAARRAQSKVDPSVVERAVREPEIRTPAQLEAKAKAREDTIETIVERVAKKLQPPPAEPVVTPKRVEAPPLPETPVTQPSPFQIP